MFCEPSTTSSASGQHCYGWYVYLATRVPGSLASAKGVDTHLQLLLGAGAINAERADNALQLFDDVRALTWKLLHR